MSRAGSCCDCENGGEGLSPRSVAGGLASISSRSSWDSFPGSASCCRSANAASGKLNFDHSSPSNASNNLNEVVQHCTEFDSRQCFGQELLSSVLPSADECGLQHKVSQLRIALQACDRVRQEGEKETDSLRRYLANVEAGASSLHLRVQELEQQLHFARTHDERDLEQLRGRICQDALQEAQSQAAAAAQAVVVAREATMELDKTKRNHSALVKSQEDEIGRLCKEVESTRLLYQARSGQVEALKERIHELERSLFVQSEKADSALKESKVDVPGMQKQIETLQLTIKQREGECSKLREVCESSNKTVKALERRVQDIQGEKMDLKLHNDCLEQQVNELQSRQVMATIAHYDGELRKVRAVLGGEKAHLLSELALLRCRNKSLRGDLAEWQQKYKALSHHVSALEPNSTTSEYQMIENPLWEGERCERKQNESGVKHKQPQQQQQQQQHSGGQELERSQPVNDEDQNDTTNQTGNHSQLPLKSCRKDCTTCETRDNILAAAHTEILKLNEINQWLLAACHNDVKLKKFTELL